jgi:hypothetical protein
MLHNTSCRQRDAVWLPLKTDFLRQVTAGANLHPTGKSFRSGTRPRIVVARRADVPMDVNLAMPWCKGAAEL